MLKLFLTFFAFFLTYNALTQEKKILEQDHVLNKALKEFKSDPELKNTSIGFLAIDTKSGETIAQFNPDISLIPASAQKVITTATALEVLGKNFRFKTILQYSGQIDTIRRVLKGNLYIKGGADPTLGSEYFDRNNDFAFISKWIDVLKKNKIDSIDGRIIADASEYGTEINSPKWTWEDVGNYFGVGANGLSAFDNMYRIYFQSPSNSGELTTITKVEPEIPGLKIYNEVLSSVKNTDEAFVFGAPYSNLQYIRGTIPKGKSEFVIKGAIPDPAYYLAWYFDKELKNSGIKIKGEATTNRLLVMNGDSLENIRTELDALQSPSLSTIIDITNKKSVNLFAEHMFNEIARKLSSNWSNPKAIKVVTDFWNSKGMDTDGLFIYDGSGLSRYNTVTARQLVFVLNYMVKKSKNFNDFFKSFPVAGESGTLKTVGNNTTAEGAIHAKSGTSTNVKAFTGYAKTKSGRMLAFSMVINNFNCSLPQAKAKLSKLMVAMADFDL
jgi:D-alanyl-D-alanine carboxypeptidase/D-alanyl-D-alanine-endopeptidase (penicillin-binding protein 4)